MYAAYTNAKTGMIDKEAAINDLLSQIEVVENKCVLIQHELADSVNELGKIALRPNCFKSANEYIDQMIQNENDSKAAGFRDRVKVLESMKEKNDMIDKTMRNEPLFKAKADVLKTLEQQGLLKRRR